jgi:2-polyprenyl-6-methoxyphenol hydroxylase-like FAD-dependent oxidoreductase
MGTNGVSLKTDHAVVIGGSVAGLLCARVLARHFSRVTVLERDRFPTDGPDDRPSVSQGRHIHLLLGRGRIEVEKIFPGFDNDLKRYQASEIDYTNDSALFSYAGRLPRFRSGLKLRLCRRRVIDWVLRSHLKREARVEFAEATTVTGLSLCAKRRQVLGVVVDRKGGARGELISADLVVDASGRTSNLPAWLGAQGLSVPREDVVNAFVGYASRFFRIAKARAPEWKAVEISAQPPHNPHAGGMFEMEDGTWLVTLVGAANVLPPVEDEGFLEFARHVASPIIYEAIKDAEPVTPIAGYRGLANRWRRYDLLRDLPSGLVVVGDAVCSYNPLYGQGMSVAAMEAAALGEVLAKAQRGSQLDGRRLGQFQNAQKRCVLPAWTLATAEDLRWPSTEGPRPGKLESLSHGYVNLLIALSPKSPQIVLSFLQMSNLLRGPEVLFRPAILWCVLRHLWGRLLRRDSTPRLRSEPVRELQ